MITVVGLGPGDETFLTSRAKVEIYGTKPLFLRTSKHPLVERLGTSYTSFDEIYENSSTFDDVYNTITDILIAESMKGDIVYAVPGNPFVSERTVELLIQKLGKDSKELEFVHGTSFIDAIISCLKIDPVHGLNIADALTPDIKIIPTSDTLFVQVYDRLVASNLKLRLSEHYSDEHEIIVVDAAGVQGLEKVEKIKLFELDREDRFTYLTSVYVPRLKEYIGDFETLLSRFKDEIIKDLDNPSSLESLSQTLRDVDMVLNDAYYPQYQEDLLDKATDLLLYNMRILQILDKEGYSLSEIYDYLQSKLEQKFKNACKHDKFNL